jgi:hypothetical protein
LDAAWREEGCQGGKVNFFGFRDLPSAAWGHLSKVNGRREEVRKMRTDWIPSPGLERGDRSVKKIAIIL